MSHDRRADADSAARLDATLATACGASTTPGAQAALIRDGAVVWRGRYGVADVTSRDGVTDETVFCLASLGKTLVAALALRLAEEGRLDLDAPVAAVLEDDLPGFQVVTPRMLLTHTSGYPDLYDTPEVSALMPPEEDEPGSGTAYDPDRPFTWQMLAPGIREPVEPGAQWEYSNAGYIVLTEMLVRLLGGPDALGAAWTALIAPIGSELTDDVLTMDRSRVRLDLLAHGYDQQADGTLVDAYAARPPAGVPTDLFGLPFGDGLFAGTAVGVARFLDSLFVGQVVLDPPTVDLMTTVTPQAAAVDHPDMRTYGMGTFRMEAGGGVWQGHRGRYGGFATLGASDRSGRSTIAVLTNCMAEDPPVVPIWRALAETVREADAAGSVRTR
jgi:CubicO group peptidase (beta-lactamase class C family)